SEEHTSELQSRENLVCRLLLEKKTALMWKSFLTPKSKNARTWWPKAVGLSCRSTRCRCMPTASRKTAPTGQTLSPTCAEATRAAAERGGLSRACSHYFSKCERGRNSANLGAGRRPDWVSGLGA